MKVFGGTGRHGGKGSSARPAPPVSGTSDFDYEDIDQITAEFSSGDSDDGKLQEMREYDPSASPVRPSPAAQVSPARPAAPAAQVSPARPASSQGFSVFDDEEPPVVRVSPGDTVHTPSDSAAPRIRGYVKPSSQPEKAAPSRSAKKKRRWPIKLAVTAVVLAALYCLCVFSNIPFIAKWRAIYIETAMGTMTHQWLATAFIPNRIIEDVMYERWKLEEQQTAIESDNSMINPASTTMGALRPSDTTTATTEATSNATTAVTTTTAPPPPEWEMEDYPLYTAFPELDRDSFIAYANENADTLYTDDGHIIIDRAGRDDAGTTIRTTNGDQVLALDTRNGILIVKVTGEDSGELYEGKLVLVRDPAQVKLGVAKNLGSVGSQIGSIVERSGAIVGINASGFQDDEGHGNGGIAYGFVMADGKKYQSAIGGKYKVIAFDNSNILNITNYKSSLDLRDGAEFRPALIIDGKIQVTGSAGWGIQPRSVIGQAADGTVLMLVIDGRQTHSVGATIGECAVILQRYGAIQACNLDGGSSSVLYYNGRVISNPSGADKINGRYLPDGFIVMPAGSAAVQED